MTEFFKLKENGTNVRTEMIAGITTFFTMAYIIFVNPNILGSEFGAGMNPGAVFVATCLTAALGTFLSGILSNYPFAQAPGMGLNAFFSFTVCGVMGYSWRAALAAVFISGIFFVLITATGLRQIIVNGIPNELKRAIAAGIGLFITLIGLSNAGIVTTPFGGVPLIGLGNFGNPSTVLALFGLLLIIALLCLKVRGSLFIGIITASVIGGIMQFVFGIQLGMSSPGITSAFGESFGEFAQAFGQCFVGFGELFSTGEGFGATFISVVTVLLVMTLTDMFDTVGTLVGCAEKGGFLDKDGNLPRVGRAMMADALTTSTGAIMGTSTVTTYIESTAGISEGGKTGLTSMFTGALFLLALLFAPVVGLIPGAATAPALIIIGIMMASSLKEIEWGDFELAVPCFIVIIFMPFAYSIADGIGLGFISYVFVKLVTGKVKKIHPVMMIFAILFFIRYILKAFGII